MKGIMGTMIEEKRKKNPYIDDRNRLIQSCVDEVKNED